MNKYLAIELAIVCKHIGTIVNIILSYNTVLLCTILYYEMFLLEYNVLLYTCFLFAFCASHGLLMCVMM